MATINVTSAIYASNRKGKDVTQACVQILNPPDKPPNDDIPVNNTSFGPDPDPNYKKYFTITFTVNGQTQYMGAEEGTTLDVSPS